jgi:protoheme IX farnesyltransferase
MSATTQGSLRSYAELTKPRLLPLVVVTGLPPIFMAGGVSPSLTLAILGGILLAAASANVLNCYVERERDALMERTRTRPLPSARLGAGSALAFGLALGGLATGVLYLAGGEWAAGLGVASILFYVFVYTIWLKPRSAWNAVIGGAAGAAAPLIADASVHGQVTAAGNAGIPMLPNVIGDHPTRWRMLWWTLGLVPVAVAPAVLGLLGPLYGVVAVGLCAWFVFESVRVLRERSDAAARSMFRCSLIVLFGLFLAMLADVAIRV